MTATRAQRKRRGVEVNLGVAAIARLRELAAVHPERTASAVIEDLLLASRDDEHAMTTIRRTTAEWAHVVAELRGVRGDLASRNDGVTTERDAMRETRAELSKR